MQICRARSADLRDDPARVADKIEKDIEGSALERYGTLMAPQCPVQWINPKFTEFENFPDFHRSSERSSIVYTCHKRPLAFAGCDAHSLRKVPKRGAW
jgi:hypothetical protein